MARTLPEGLAEFSPTDTTYRLVGGVLRVIPGAPGLSPDPNLAAVAARLGATRAQLAEAERIAATDPAIRDILWMSALVDTADKSYAIYTGVSSAVKMFWGSADTPTPEPERPSRSKGYAKDQSKHQLRRYKQLMALRQERTLYPQERQELRHLQQEIRETVERREQSNSAPSFPGGPGRRGPPSFPGGPGGSGGFEQPAWSRQPDGDLGEDFPALPEKSFQKKAAKSPPRPSKWERGLAALETDTQQRNDAVVKALAIAYLAHRAFPGSLRERAQRFAATPAGQGLLVYYAAVEVGLPFADNALLAGGDMMKGLLGGRVEEQLTRLAGLAGGRSLGDTAGMLQQLSGWMQTAVDTAAPYIDTVARGASAYLPIGANAADKLAGLAANAADVMPSYRLLGARLAAEAAVLRAMDPR